MKVKREREKSRLMLNSRKRKIILTSMLSEFIINSQEVKMVYSFSLLHLKLYKDEQCVEIKY